MAIKFVYGSQSQYDNLAQAGALLEDGVYFINDTQRIYRGSKLVASTDIQFVSQLPETPQKNQVYVVSQRNEDTGEYTNDVFVSNENGTVKIPTSLDDFDASSMFNMLAKFTSVDLENDNWGEDPDSKFVTAGALKKALDWVYMRD